MHRAIGQADDYRPDIDGLRAIAVMAVVLFHTFPNIVPHGFAGVDVFFVISGYLISHIIFSGTAGNRFYFRTFYARRIRRILPALIAVLLGCLVMGWFALTTEEYSWLGAHILASSLFIENFLLWNEAGYFDQATSLKPLMHLWSLSVEEQFYLVYPCAIWLISKTRANRLVLLLSCAVLSLGLAVIGLPHHPDAVFYLLPTRFWELLAGACIAHIQLADIYRSGNFPGMHKKVPADAVAACGLVFIVTGMMLSGDNFRSQLLSWLLAVTGTILLLATPGTTLLQRRLFAARPVVYLGLISYPLYLWHWSLLSFARLVHSDNAITVSGRIVVLSTSAVLACITYHGIERPLRRKPASIFLVTTLIILLLTIAAAGFCIIRMKGIPSRYPDAVKMLADYHFDEKTYAHYQRCWVDRETPPEKFSPACRGALASTASGHTFLVWGDSHAAHLYPAIDKLFGNTGQVAEYTRSTCAPVLGAGNQDCIRGNDFVMDMVKTRPPETVILFAFWNSYSDRWQADREISAQLLDTLRALREAGVRRILFIGPAPQWSGKVPSLVFRATLDDAPRYRVPERLTLRLDPISKIVEADLRQLVSTEANVEYFSVMNTLCNDDGCLVRTTEAPDSLTSYDYAHLTGFGADYVAHRLPLPYPETHGM